MATSFAYRILVVDDDETVLETTAAILKNAGYSVNTARDGFEALANLREGIPELLISDLHMPAMSGFELLGVVRKRFPSVIVVATSGQYTPASLPEGVLADRFIPKGDMPPIELLEIVRELIADGPSRPQPVRAEIAPAWLPRSTRGYVVLTCTHCLRSFSILSKGRPTWATRHRSVHVLRQGASLLSRRERAAGAAHHGRPHAGARRDLEAGDGFVAKHDRPKPPPHRSRK